MPARFAALFALSLVTCSATAAPAAAPPVAVAAAGCDLAGTWTVTVSAVGAERSCGLAGQYALTIAQDPLGYSARADIGEGRTAELRFEYPKAEAAACRADLSFSISQGHSLRMIAGTVGVSDRARLVATAWLGSDGCEGEGCPNCEAHGVELAASRRPG